MKRVSLFLAFTLFLSILFSCGTDTGINDKTIVLAWDFGVEKPVWQKIADEYMELNPDVKVVLDQKDGQTYSSWLSGQLLKGNPDADIVVNNIVRHMFNSGKFADYSEYLNRPNKYADNAVWKDTLEKNAYSDSSAKGQIYSLNNLQVITVWFYNKDIFDKYNVSEYVGKEPQEWSFDDLIKACELLDSNGIIPLSISGNYQSFWAWQFGWLFRTYADQYFRDLEHLVISQPGDYNYDEELQSTFTLDIQDPYNDSENNFIYNEIRLAKLVRDNVIGPAHEKFQSMVSNLSRLVPRYVPEGFTSISLDQVAPYFLRGEAAIFIDKLNFYAGIERTFQDVGVTPFEVGMFKYPYMTGDNIGVEYTRDMGGAAGAYGVIYKNKEKTDLCMDFMMFLFSKKGQGIYFAEMSNQNIAPSGISLIKDVEIPERWKGKYDVEFNGIADNNPLVNFARGFYDEQESVRGFVEYSQAYFGQGTISVEQYCNNLQKNCIDSIPYWLRNMNYRQNALDDPSQNPLK